MEFDARATLSNISREGIFLDPLLLPRRVSRSELVLLVDVHGSMSPFHDLARRLTQTALDGGRFRRVRTFYFHNTPDDLLMTSPAFTDAVPLRRFVEDTPSRQTVLVIVSETLLRTENRETYSADSRPIVRQIVHASPARDEAEAEGVAISPRDSLIRYRISWPLV